jgi:hypothetical protein
VEDREGEAGRERNYNTEHEEEFIDHEDLSTQYRTLDLISFVFSITSNILHTERKFNFNDNIPNIKPYYNKIWSFLYESKTQISMMKY